MTKRFKKFVITVFAMFILCLMLSFGGTLLLDVVINHSGMNSDTKDLLHFFATDIGFIIFALTFIPSIIIFGVKQNRKINEIILKYGKQINFKLVDVFYYNTGKPSFDRVIFCIVEDLNTHELYRVNDTALDIIWADFKDDNFKSVKANVNGISKQINIGDTITGWILPDSIKEEKFPTKNFTYYKDAKITILKNILYNFNQNNDMSLLDKPYKICDGLYKFN